MSRRGVALRAGVPPSSLHEWLERGRAHPGEEPWGSFTVDYQRAERGLDQASSTAVALRVQAILEAQQGYLDWQTHRGPEPAKPWRPDKPGKDADPDEQAEYDAALHAYQEAFQAWQAAWMAWATPPPVPSTQDFEWLLRVQTSRYPQDYGTHAHRQPELDPSGDAWLERTGITHAQLVHLLREPPEAISRALVEAGDAVYALLVASGWHPQEAR